MSNMTSCGTFEPRKVKQLNHLTAVPPAMQKLSLQEFHPFERTLGQATISMSFFKSLCSETKLNISALIWTFAVKHDKKNK